MDFFAVTGRPVLHSKSPQIFNSYFRNHSLPSHYTRLAADSAHEAMDLFKEIGLKGMNITAPFKIEILPHLQQLDPAAEQIGSVNTVVREGHIFKGYNTDYLGVSGALESQGLSLHGRRCLVIGAGGAGRSAVYALKQKGCEVTLLNRNLEKARRIAQTIGCAAGSLEELEAHIGEFQIIVFTIPPPSLALDAWPMHPGQVLLDANYQGPSYGQMAAEKGIRYIPGEEWLKYQAIPAFKLFLGIEIPVESVDWPQVLQSPPLRSRDNIALIGFMGSGKSTIGRRLAARMNYEFLDIDDWIEKKEGESIKEIFKTKSEAYFRGKEKEAIAKFTSIKRLVLACGGGAVMDGDNRRLLAEHSLVIWIYTSLKATFSRNEISKWPLLQHPQPFAHAQELLRRRLADYFRCADLVVGNERTPGQTVGKINEEIGISL
jgi:shikimate dehydrogenase